MTDQEKELIKTTTRIVQDMAYKISDLCERYPDGAAVFFLAAEQLHIRALQLRARDRHQRPEPPAGPHQKLRVSAQRDDPGAVPGKKGGGLMPDKYKVTYEGFAYVIADSEAEAIAKYIDGDFVYMEQAEVEAAELDEFEVVL